MTSLSSISRLLGAAALACAALTSCDNIGEDERFIEVEKVHGQKVVLIEKFTGLGCVNCPAGDEMIHSIMEAYPGQVVAVSMHPKPGISEFNRKLGTFDLRTEQAQPYFAHYGITTMPYAVFDGQSDDNSSATPKWSAVVKELLTEVPPVNIAVLTAYDETTRTASASWAVDVLDPVADGMSLLCWVIENHIVGPQKFISGVNESYEHNHVFRATANGTWGTELAPGPSAKGARFDGVCRAELDETWVAANCQMVVFVFDTASKKVLQAAVAPVVAAE